MASGKQSVSSENTEKILTRTDQWRQKSANLLKTSEEKKEVEKEPEKENKETANLQSQIDDLQKIASNAKDTLGDIMKRTEKNKQNIEKLQRESNNNNSSSTTNIRDRASIERLNEFTFKDVPSVNPENATKKATKETTKETTKKATKETTKKPTNADDDVEKETNEDDDSSSTSKHEFPQMPEVPASTTTDPNKTPISVAPNDERVEKYTNIIKNRLRKLTETNLKFTLDPMYKRGEGTVATLSDKYFRSNREFWEELWTYHMTENNRKKFARDRIGGLMDTVNEWAPGVFMYNELEQINLEVGDETDGSVTMDYLTQHQKALKAPRILHKGVMEVLYKIATKTSNHIGEIGCEIIWRNAILNAFNDQYDNDLDCAPTDDDVRRKYFRLEENALNNVVDSVQSSVKIGENTGVYVGGASTESEKEQNRKILLRHKLVCLYSYYLELNNHVYEKMDAISRDLKESDESDPDNDQLEEGTMNLVYEVMVVLTAGTKINEKETKLKGILTKDLDEAFSENNPDNKNECIRIYKDFIDKLH